MRTTPTIGATVLALLALWSAVPAAHAEQKAWHTANFRFQMSGLPATKGAAQRMKVPKGDVRKGTGVDDQGVGERPRWHSGYSKAGKRLKAPASK